MKLINKQCKLIVCHGSVKIASVDKQLVYWVGVNI